MKDNLEWLNTWEKMFKDGKIEKTDFLTSSTAEGLRVTIMSTIELSTYLLECCGFRYVLSGKMNQDPLEVPFEVK